MNAQANWKSTRSALMMAVLLIVGGAVWVNGVVAQQPPAAQPKINFPGHDAYRTALADAETQYTKQVLDARKAYLQTMKDVMARKSMTPETYKAYQAEIKRIESLGKPRVDPEPAAGGVKQVSIKMDTPNPLWSIEFAKAKAVDGELWVLWQLQSKDGMGAAVISSVSAEAKLNTGDLPADAAVKHFVIGKRWNWQDPNVKATYVDAEGDLGEEWAKAAALKQTEK